MLLLLQDNTEPTEPLAPAVDRQNPGEQQSSPSILGHFLETLTLVSLMGISGESAEPRYWGCDCDKREEDGLATVNTWSMADRVHACKAQAVMQTSGFVQLQNQAGVQPDQGTQWSPDLSDSDPKMSFVDPGAWFAHIEARC